jgi:hypothetical protein
MTQQLRIRQSKRRLCLSATKIRRMDHQAKRPIPIIAGEPVAVLGEFPTLVRGGDDAFQANIVPPIEPVCADGNQQIDTRDIRNLFHRFHDMPTQVNSRRVGLTRLVSSNQIVAANIAFGKLALGRGLNRSGNAEQATVWPISIQYANVPQAFTGLVRFKGEREAREGQIRGVAIQVPKSRLHIVLQDKDCKTAQAHYRAAKTNHDCNRSPARKIKTPPLAGKRNGGAGTEKRPKPSILMIPSFSSL